MTDEPRDHTASGNFSFKPLAHILGLLLGWVVLVLVLRALLPPAQERTSIVRGAAYLAYLIVASS
jgi:hypothetical protein